MQQMTRREGESVGKQPAEENATTERALAGGRFSLWKVLMLTLELFNLGFFSALELVHVFIHSLIHPQVLLNMSSLCSVGVGGQREGQMCVNQTSDFREFAVS